jgi:hypothetical protein
VVPGVRICSSATALEPRSRWAPRTCAAARSRSVGRLLDYGGEPHWGSGAACCALLRGGPSSSRGLRSRSSGRTCTLSATRRGLNTRGSHGRHLSLSGGSIVAESGVTIGGPRPIARQLVTTTGVPWRLCPSSPLFSSPCRPTGCLPAPPHPTPLPILPVRAGFLAAFLVFELPAGRVVRRRPGLSWLPGIVATWGLLQVATAAVHILWLFGVTRTLLRAVEVGLSGSVMAALSRTLPRGHHARAWVVFFSVPAGGLIVLLAPGTQPANRVPAWAVAGLGGVAVALAAGCRMALGRGVSAAGRGRVSRGACCCEPRGLPSCATRTRCRSS